MIKWLIPHLFFTLSFILSHQGRGNYSFILLHRILGCETRVTCSINFLTTPQSRLSSFEIQPFIIARRKENHEKN